MLNQNKKDFAKEVAIWMYGHDSEENLEYAQSLVEHARTKCQIKYAMEVGMCLGDWDEWQLMQKLTDLELPYDVAVRINSMLWENGIETKELTINYNGIHMG